MALPLYDGANYQLRRESPELHREFQESRDGKLVAGWELRVPDRGPDGVPYQFIFVGPTQEHRGSAIRLRMMAKDGGEPDDSAAVTVESYYKSGSERVVIFSGTYGQFRRIPDQHAANAAVAAQVRSEAGEDYVVRVAVACPDGGPRPDPVADDSYFELDCVKLWWNETA